MADKSSEKNEMTNPTSDKGMTNLTSDNDMAETAVMSLQNGNDDTTEAMSAQNSDADNTTDIKAAAVQNGNDDTTETILVTNTDAVADDAEDDNPAQTGNAESKLSETGGNRVEAENPVETEMGTASSAESKMAAETETETGTATKPESRIKAGDAAETGINNGTETGGTASGAPNHAGFVPPSNFAGDSAPSGAYVRVPRDLPRQMPKPQPPAGPSKATIVLSLLPLFLGAVMLFIGSAFPMVFGSIPGSVDVRSLIAMTIVVLGALLIVLAVLLGLSSLIHRVTTKWRSRKRQ